MMTNRRIFLVFGALICLDICALRFPGAGHKSTGDYVTNASSDALQTGESCLAFFNTTDEPVELVVDVYARQERGLRRAFASTIGRKRDILSVPVEIPANNLVSIVGIAQRGTKDEQRQFIESISLVLTDGELLPLDEEAIEKLNKHFAQYEDGEFACSDSPSRREQAVMILNDERLGLLSDVSKRRLDEFGNFGNGYYLGHFDSIPTDFNLSIERLKSGKFF